MTQTQLNVRISDEARQRAERLAAGRGQTLTSVVESAVNLLFDAESTLDHGFLNESDMLSCLAALESYQHDPSFGNASHFIRRYGSRLLETARAWACVADGRCSDPREAPIAPWLVGEVSA